MSDLFGNLKPKGGVKGFDPATGIPSLEGKVIFITGGTTGLGAESVRALAAHTPLHIYFSGRNTTAGEALTTEIKSAHPNVGLTFVQIDQSSLASVKSAVKKNFIHDRLDILLNNAGIMAQPAALSKDGYEIQFATNHLGHAMLTQQLLPKLLNAAQAPHSDVRIINLTSEGFRLHEARGICFDELDAGSVMSRKVLGAWVRYGQSKLANILFAAEFARRYPQITSVSVHPGVVKTDLVNKQTFTNKLLIHGPMWLSGQKMVEKHEGAYNQLWCAAGAKKEQVRNGSYYMPVGSESYESLDKVAKDEKLAGRLWDWTEGVLAKF
ncbi:hypothetical protein BDV95DRAFT_489843 [Massariosphaeria phaeospora]|uniref:Uncharacterized protein n=1 Tax=Massariosphaeria phaeospora TaxID=100035 RepID=A0A7C8IGK1_9PLEO|nr:hypothetical protein BDV95DRAFT_489843 [Massariosphaeria phaeospora]